MGNEKFLDGLVMDFFTDRTPDYFLGTLNPGHQKGHIENALNSERIRPQLCNFVPESKKLYVFTPDYGFEFVHRRNQFDGASSLPKAETEENYERAITTFRKMTSARVEPESVFVIFFDKKSKDKFHESLSSAKLRPAGHLIVSVLDYGRIYTYSYRSIVSPTR